MLLHPCDVWLWTGATILAAAGLVLLGRFALVQRVVTALALALAAAVFAATVGVRPNPGALATGLALSGAAGMLWYSYLAARAGVRRGGG